jgi:hypothetical protein
MIPIRDAVLTRLRLEEAVHDEAKSWQSLIPSAPGWDQLDTNAAAFANWLKGQLSVGLPLARNVVLSAQKPSKGIRPIPIWGFAERVTYRALVDFILRNETPLDRSVEAYQGFASAPLSYAMRIEPKTGTQIRLSVASSIIQYVVKTDVTAFYDYIDHEILARELLVRTGDNEAISCLISLLSEIQGRTYGIPQLLDPSDRLSEIYIDIAERSVLRRGWPTWRFNDDFRIATRSFSDALAAIEDIAEAMRDIGLTLSDSKTTTPRYNTYVFEAIGLSVDDEVPDEMQRILTGDAEGDYIEGVGLVSPEQSLELIERTYISEDSMDKIGQNGIDLRSLSSYEFRQLRRSLGQLIRTGTPGALPHAVKLISYVHALTPWIIRYVSKAGAQQIDQAAAVLDEIVGKTSLNDWQRIWIARAVDELGLLESGSPGDQPLRVTWMSNLRHARHSPTVAAEAALALSAAGLIAFDDLEYALRDQPIALNPWYISAISRLHQQGMVTNEEYMAVHREGGLFAIMLPRLSS